jgi:hypothetical protein
VQRILGRPDDLCNKKIALVALSLTNHPILHGVLQFTARSVQRFINCRHHSLQFNPLFASIDPFFPRARYLKSVNPKQETVSDIDAPKKG